MGIMASEFMNGHMVRARLERSAVDGWLTLARARAYLINERRLAMSHSGHRAVAEYWANIHACILLWELKGELQKEYAEQGKIDLW